MSGISRLSFSLVSLVMALATALVVACGQVITRPTPTPTPPVVVAMQATARPTATPAPYTPEPTPTPTITPTPIFYTIRRGDTLLRIASEFGITVEALQEANGITDPRLLRIGQTLIIPPAEEDASSADATPTATPTPMPFAIENLTFSRAPTGELWCLGEVLNTSAVSLEQVRVQIALLDDTAAIVAQAQALVEADLIEPGRRAPFMVEIPNAPITFANYQASPLTGVPAYLGSYYRDLEVRDVSPQAEHYAAYRLSGRVANIGPEDAVGVNVVVTVYDALGRVIGVRRAPPAHNVIPRGGETTFEIAVVPVGGPVVTYTVMAQGRRLPTPTAVP